MLCFEQNCGEIDLNTKRRFIDYKYDTYIATLSTLWNRPLCWFFTSHLTLISFFFFPATFSCCRFYIHSSIHSFILHLFVSYIYPCVFFCSLSLTPFIFGVYMYCIRIAPITTESNKWNSITWNPKDTNTDGYSKILQCEFLLSLSLFNRISSKPLPQQQ